MFIYTSRLVLRPADRGDLDDLVRLDADPEVMRYVSGGIPTPRDVIENWILPRAHDYLRAGSGGLWSVVDRVDGRFVGWLSLRTPRHSSCSELELSYRLRREWWGLGMASEAATALVDMSFREHAAQRLFASTTVANVASRRVMEKIGMRLSGVHTSDSTTIGAHGDEVEYELLRSQWELVQSEMSQWEIGQCGWIRDDRRLGGISA